MVFRRKTSDEDVLDPVNVPVHVSNLGAVLLSVVERIERLEEEKGGLAADIREVYSEAKGAGFDTKVLRRIIALRKMDAADRQELDEMLELYWDSLTSAEKDQVSKSVAEGA